jgi:DNA-binding IclR family transcriptional regulator
MTKQNSPIQVVDRAFDLLELLAQTNKPMRSTDIAKQLDISLQSVNNLLRTLYQRGYVSQNSSRNYRLGSQCLYLGSFADRWAPIRNKVAKPLRDLVTKSSFTGFVGVIENDRLLSIATLNPGKSNLSQPSQDWWGELHSTACGRILLAAMSVKERSKLLARITRKKMTPATIIDTNELENICSNVNKAGYAEVLNESRLGTSSLAVGLRNSKGMIVAGVGISGLNAAWNKDSFKRKLALLNDMAENIKLPRQS